MAHQPQPSEIALRFLTHAPTRRELITRSLGIEQRLRDAEGAMAWSLLVLHEIKERGLVDELVSHRAMFGPIHWVGDAPTSLHGNGADSFERVSRNPAEVDCRLCLTLLTREEPRSFDGRDN